MAIIVEMKKLKEKLHEQCVILALQKRNTILQAIQAQQEAANNETKSSAGDKYETGRAMAHFEQEKLGLQLTEANKVEKLISSIDPVRECTFVESGSLVETNTGLFYIAVGLGMLKIDDHSIFAISPTAPVAQQMLGLKKGDTYSFSNKQFTIKEIQ